MDVNKITFGLAAAHVGEWRNAFGFLGNLKEGGYVEDIGVNGR
jgi:hypothetical protein